MNSLEIKQLLENKKYLLSINEYLLMIDNMDNINRLSYNREQDFFEINLNEYGNYIFRLKKEQ